MKCPTCYSNQYILTNGKKQCMGCGYEEGGTMAENPALFKTRVDEQTMRKKHDGCDNVMLRMSRIRLVRGRRSIVYVCNSCGFEEEYSI